MVGSHLFLRRICVHIDDLGGKITKNFGVEPYNSTVFHTSYCFLTIFEGVCNCSDIYERRTEITIIIIILASSMNFSR